MILLLASAAGALLFLWPLMGGGPTATTPALLVAIGIVVALGAVEAGARRLDARRLTLLAALAAMDAGLRLLLVVGLEGFSPVFFLMLCAGYVFGPSYGFLVGSCSLMLSALVTGGVGPWLPFQMLAAGWVGAAAGLVGMVAPRVGWRALALLAATGVLTGFLYGGLMDLWDWTTFYRDVPDLGWVPGLAAGAAVVRFGRFYLATSLFYDTFRAIGNAAMVLVLGAPIIAAMRRFRARFTVVFQAA